jgi:hypothetical protein
MGRACIGENAMKTLPKVLLLSICALGLGACASTQEQAYQPEPPAPGSVVTDAEYVAYVEAVARRRGIDVQWVNRPTKRVAKE